MRCFARLPIAATLFLLLATCWQPASISADEAWPGWRGPGRDGWVGSFQPPGEWPEKLDKAWAVEVGTGYASPLVGGGRIYQHARQGEEEVVWCLKLETGDVLWRQSYRTPFTIGSGAHRHGKGPKSTPALADGRLFTLSITGLLIAWNADSGELLWRRDFSSRFEKGHPYWGASTSPLVDGNRVILHVGTDGRGALVALDVASGEQIWSQGEDGPSYASPILIEIDGVRQIVELTQKSLVGVDAESGELLWEFAYPQRGTDQNMVTPVYHGGLILLGGESRGIYGLEVRLVGGEWKVEERWHQKDVALDMSSAVVNNDLLFGFSHYDQGRLFCLDPGSGEVLWQGRARTGDNVMFLSIPGHVVALIDTGQLQILSAQGEEYELVADYQVAEGETWAPPVLVNGQVLVKDRETLTLWALGEHGAALSSQTSPR